MWEEDSGGSGGATRILYAFGGKVIAQRDSTTSTVSYLHGDHLGSTSLLTNQAGGVVSQQEFDPWGKVRTSVSGSISQTSINYTGQRLDGTGLLFYHSRYYDPGLGKFVSPDKLIVEPSNPQTFNRYSYVVNNPMRYRDPSGYCAKNADGTRNADGGANSDCWQKYEETNKKLGLGYVPGLDDWDEGKLNNLLGWLNRGIRFTSNNFNVNLAGGVLYGIGTDWTAAEIGYILDQLNGTGDFLKKTLGFTDEMVDKALGIGNGNTLTFNRYVISPGQLYAAFYDDVNNQINVAFGADLTNLNNFIYHELGHAIDRNAARVAKTGTGYWSDAYWPGRDREDYANSFHDWVLGKLTDKGTINRLRNSLITFYVDNYGPG